MGNEWQLLELNDLSKEITVGFVGSMTHEYVDTGIPFLRSKNIAEHVINWDDIRFISTEFHEKLKKSALRPGDVAIVRTGKPGVTCVIPETLKIANCSDLVIVRVDDTRLNPYFLSYFMNSVAAGQQVNSHVVGAVQQHFNVGAAKKIKLLLPPISEQEVVVDVLRSLDNKITLNRQLNQTLEQMAQALFKSWFVDFDPVIDNALAAGNPIPEDLQDRAERRQLQLAKADHKPLPENIRKLFPSEFELTESLGWVPKGWEEGSLLQSVDLVGGGTPKTTVEEFWNGDIPWFSVVDAPNDSDIFVINTEKYVTQEGVDKSSTKMLRAGTTIISARGTVGKCAFVARPMAMNQSCYGVQGKENFPDEYVYFLIRCNVSDLQKRGHGSVFNTITKDTFESIIAPRPSPEVLKVFSELAKPKFEKVLSNGYQIIELSQLRDTLLPKLISGELRIPEAQAQLEEALV